MSNNVVRSLNRPCALAQWRSPSTHTAARRCYSDETEETSPVSRSKASREENLHLLRVADQKYLREAKGQTNDLINKVQKVKDHVAAIPLKIQPNPNIPAYTFGYPKKLFTGKFVEEADRTIKSAENARQHLTDLQYKPYERNGKNALMEFEKKIEKWSDEQKKDTLKRWQYEDEAMLARLNRESQKLKEDVQRIVEQDKQSTPPRTPMPAFRSAKGAEKEKKAETKPSSLPPPSSLAEIQSQLQASINLKKNES